MAFAGDYSTSQGVDVQSFVITDTSTGSDPNLTTRSISLFKTDNTLLGGSAIAWPLSDGSTKLISALLTKDYSLNIVVEWSSSSPIPGSTYTKAGIVTFVGNSDLFAEGLLQQIGARQGITNDAGFESNLALVNSDIENALRAASYADQGNSQQCLDRIYNKIVNQNLYF